MKQAFYVQSPLTGLSGTRTFVEAFLESSCGPVEDPGGAGRTRSVYDSVYSTVSEPQAPLYENKPRNPTKTYIGRASRPSSHVNPNEYLWCLIADVSQACKKLDDRSRRALALKYCCDWSSYSIADSLGLSESTIHRIVDKALNKIAAILDGTEND